MYSWNGNCERPKGNGYFIMKMASSGLYVVVVLCKVSHTVAARSCSTVRTVQWRERRPKPFWFWVIICYLGRLKNPAHGLAFMSLLNTILESTEVLQSSVLYRVFNNSVFAGFVFRNIWRILDSRVSLQAKRNAQAPTFLRFWLFWLLSRNGLTQYYTFWLL